MLLTIILIALASLLLTAAVVAAYLQYSINRVPKVKGDGIKIACVGDSITQGIGVLFDQRHRNSYPSLLQEMLGNEYQVLNYGHSGRTLLQSSSYPYRNSPFFAASQTAEPAVVLIMLGTNDSKPDNWDSAEYERQLAELVVLYKNLPSHPIVYLLVPPAVFIADGKTSVGFQIRREVIENEIVPAVKHVARRTNTGVIDIFSATKDHPEYFPDGVHPNAAGNKAIAEVVFSSLSQSPVSVDAFQRASIGP